MKKPQIFIAMHYLELGGAETALIGLLHALDYSKVDVDLFIYSHRGELMPQIPPQVNLLPEMKAYAYMETPIKETIKAGQFGVAAGRWLAHHKFNSYRKKVKPSTAFAIYGFIGRYLTPFLPKIGNKVYDLAISFLTPHDIVLHKVRAKKKACWIHTDYSYVDVNTALEQPVWNGYDHIISISSDVSRSFCTKFPTLADKLLVIENIMPQQYIRQKSLECTPEEMKKNHFNILSIGRFTHQKNFENVPDICRRLIDTTGRNDIRWYLIGYGHDENYIRSRISAAGMEEHVIILGKRDNPYPYIKACDLYVQPSRYEGKSITVREAQTLGCPVVITNYATASSQITHGIDGMIVPLDNAACAEALAKIVVDEELCRHLSDNVAARDFSGMAEADKIYSIL